MRRNKEIIILLVLLLGTMAFVLGYVINRRAQNRAAPPPPAANSPAVGPLAPTPTKTAAPVDLSKHDGQTIDFSSGQPVVKNSPEDQAIIAAAQRDLAEAVKEVTFEPASKK